MPNQRCKVNMLTVRLYSFLVTIFARIMDVRILFTLLVFCFLFLGGGAMLVNGFLTGKKKQIWWGLGMLAICLLLMLLGFYA